MCVVRVTNVTWCMYKDVIINDDYNDKNNTVIDDDDNDHK